MDEGRKTTDQKLFETLIFIRPHFDHFHSSRGLIDVAHSGGNPGPEKDAPGCLSFVNRFRKNGWLLNPTQIIFRKMVQKKLRFFPFLIIITPASENSVENPNQEDKR